MNRAATTLTRAEPRKAGRLPGLDAPEERGKGQIEPAQRLLQGVAAEIHELGPSSLDLGQCVLLVVITDRLARLARRIDAFFECRVVKLAVQLRPSLCA